jgi:hypothetical protein
VIYFIGEIAEPHGPMKIGYTCGHGIARVLMRLEDLQRGNPRGLRVYAMLSGESMEESAMHSRFASSRIHGEWFAQTVQMADVLREHAVPLRPYPPLWSRHVRARTTDRDPGLLTTAGLSSMFPGISMMDAGRLGHAEFIPHGRYVANNGSIGFAFPVQEVRAWGIRHGYRAREAA